MEQLSLFQAVYEPFKVKGKLKLIECFGGIGAQSKALEVLGANFCHHKLVEWAVPSIKAYNSIHIKDFNNYAANLTKEELIQRVNGISVDYNQPLTMDQLQKKPVEWLADVYNNMVATHDLCPDISRVKASDLEIESEDTRQDTYILTYSFPCQDLSNAGKMAGMKKGSNTRSGLLWEVERILYELKELKQRPNVLIMENVQGVLSDLESWNSWLDSLSALGYSNYYKKVNAKNYGIPQNRLRVFMVSILGDYSFVFPRPVKLKYRLKDFLDKGEVDEKYYLSEKQINDISSWNAYEKPLEHINEEITGTITTRSGEYTSSMKLVSEVNLKRGYSCEVKEESGDSEEIQPIGNYSKSNFGQTPILSKNGIAPTITENHGQLPAITTDDNSGGGYMIKNATKQGYLFAEEGDGVDISGRMESHRGTVQKGSCQTITTMGGENVGVVVKNEK